MNTPDSRIKGPDAKTSEQIQAEEELRAFIAEKEEVISGERDGSNIEELRIKRLILRSQLGKWGLLLSPKRGSEYTLWYIDRRDEKVSGPEGELKVIFLDLADQKLKSVAKCLEDNVVGISNAREVRTEEGKKAKNLAKLIHGASGVAVNHINDELGFTGNSSFSLESLLEKSK